MYWLHFQSRTIASQRQASAKSQSGISISGCSRQVSTLQNNAYNRDVSSGALEKVAALPGGAEAVSSVAASSLDSNSAARQAFPVRLA